MPQRITQRAVAIIQLAFFFRDSSRSLFAGVHKIIRMQFQLSCKIFAPAWTNRSPTYAASRKQQVVSQTFAA